MGISLHLLPIIIFLWFPVTFVVTYVIAVARKDVVPLFPYISDTGTFSPESCIFGQMLNMGSVLIACVVFFRYKLTILMLNEEPTYLKVLRLNKLSSYLGYISAFGISVVGNFQETNIFAIHIIGAFFAFGIGAVYLHIQVFISFRIENFVGNRNVNVVRLVLAILSGICAMVCFVTGGLSLLYYEGDDITKWKKEDGGYELHLASSVTEWITCIATMTFILTYTNELRGVTFEDVIISLDHPSKSRQSNKISPVTVNTLESQKF